MKRLQRLLALLLVLLTVLSLWGCDDAPAGTTDPVASSAVSSTAAATTVTEPKEVNAYFSTAPETLDNPDNLPVLNWVCTPFLYSNMVVGEKAADSFNQALADRGMPFRVQFQIITTDDIDDVVYLCQKPEVQALIAEADLLHLFVTGESEYQYLQPLTQYITGDAQPSLAAAVPSQRHWLRSTHNGEIYGIYYKTIIIIGNGWRVDDDVFDAYGYSVDDFQGKYYWEMDDLFAALYEANGGKTFLYREDGTVSWNESTQAIYPVPEAPIIMNRFQRVASVYCVDNYGSDTPTVVNYLDTEYTRNLQTAVKRYTEAGYCTTYKEKRLVQYGNVFCGTVTSYRGEYSIPVEEMEFNYAGDGGFMSGISVTTEYTQEALSLLALLGDADFRQLMYTFSNVSSEDYTNTDSSTYKTTLFFLNPFRDMEDLEGSDIYFPAEEGKTKLETYQEQAAKAVLRVPIGIFDYSSLTAEMKAVTDVARPYLARFAELTEEEYEQMIADIKAAGGDKIQAELQRQLDEWLAENPDWPEG